LFLYRALCFLLDSPVAIFCSSTHRGFRVRAANLLGQRQRPQVYLLRSCQCAIVAAYTSSSFHARLRAPFLQLRSSGFCSSRSPGLSRANAANLGRRRPTLPALTASATLTAAPTALAPTTVYSPMPPRAILAPLTASAPKLPSNAEERFCQSPVVKAFKPTSTRAPINMRDNSARIAPIQ